MLLISIKSVIRNNVYEYLETQIRWNVLLIKCFVILFFIEQLQKLFFIFNKCDLVLNITFSLHDRHQALDIIVSFFFCCCFFLQQETN